MNAASLPRNRSEEEETEPGGVVFPRNQTANLLLPKPSRVNPPASLSPTARYSRQAAQAFDEVQDGIDIGCGRGANDSS